MTNTLDPDPRSGAVLARPNVGAGTAPMLPQDGDVLIARRIAMVDYDVMIMPGRQYVTHARHDLAVATGREAAELLGVDLWMTEDHIHFWRLAAYRDTSRRED